MRKQMFKKVSLLLLMSSISVANAARPLSEQAGWETTLSLNAVYINERSQLSTNSENKVTNNLNNSGKSTSTKILFPLSKMFYTLDTLKTQLYFDANSSDQIKINGAQYELGIKHQFKDDSKLTFAAFPQLSIYNEVWKDPFLTGAERKKTAQSVGGARIAIEQVFASPFTLKYAIAHSNIEDELSGQNSGLTSGDIALLDRDSVYQRFALETMFPIQSGLFLKPVLEKNKRNAKGNANSFEGVSLALSALMFQAHSLWVNTVSMGKETYEVNNPLFNKKQNTQFLSVSTFYNLKNPLNLQNWSWTVLGSYTRRQSDITFYDSDTFVFVTSMNYQF